MNLYYIQTKGKTFIRHIFDVEPTHWEKDNFCLARRLTPEQATRLGVSQLKLITPPYFDPATQKREHGPALLIKGVWTQNYIVSNMDTEEAAAKAEVQWGIIRAERNLLLARSDWWVTKAAETGAVISDDQRIYRQALRDITAESNPFEIIWPAAPSVL